MPNDATAPTPDLRPRRTSGATVAAALVLALVVGLAVPATALAFGVDGPETCKSGFFWRQACGLNDHVCVTFTVRSQTVADNAAASSRLSHADINNVDACTSGFVWRSACGPQDHVCVSPSVKTQAANDNAAAASRFQDTPVLSDVLTQHNDAARTGANLNETTLTPANVTPTTFGRWFERSVDGQIIAQPLYESNQTFPGLGQKNVVYVATRKNLVYAIDADETNTNPVAGRLWNNPASLETFGPVAGMCPETRGAVGVTSTPVIDRASDTMYIVARRNDNSLWLHALDVGTGQPKSGTPGVVQITAPNFNNGLELSRAGLLLQNGAIFVAFSALNCDNPGWNGYVIAYRAPDLKQVGVFSAATSTNNGAGVWQSGNGLVGDGTNVFFATGNRDPRGPNTADSMLDESFVKLAVGAAPNYGLTVAGHYTVSNRAALNGGDTDLGSGGPVLLPNNRLVGGGKQGKLYVLDSSTMAAAQNPASGPVVPGGSDGFQAFVNTWHDDNSQVACTDARVVGRNCYMLRTRYEDSELWGPNIHGGPVFWRSASATFGLLYAMPEKDFLRSYRYNNTAHTVSTTANAVSSVRSPDGMPGAFLSLSANGGTNGIIWASAPKVDGQWQNVPGVLIAFNATSLAEIWRDDDAIGFSKFTPPTVAGGKVFRPTFADKLIVYGPKTAATALPCYTIAQKYQNYTGVDGVLGTAIGVADSVAPDGVGHFHHYDGDPLGSDPVFGGSIYWTPTGCAWEVHGPIRDAWAAIGWETSPLGYPTTDQIMTPDGRGRFNHFGGGSVYWSPFTGAHEIYGAIRDKWASLGWETSALGYPMSGETEEMDNSGRFNLFEHGTIHWSAVTGAVTVKSDTNMVMSLPRYGIDRGGGDLTHFDLPSGLNSVCAQKCADNTSCVGWTLVAAGVQGPNPVCWLKSSLSLEAANANTTTGIKVQIRPANMSAMEGRIDRPGMDITHFDLPSTDPRLCQGECAINPACRAWTYVEPNANYNIPVCWLKNGVPAQIANGITVSGTKP